MLHSSRLTSRFQATVPMPVRKALHQKAADRAALAEQWKTLVFG